MFFYFQKLPFLNFATVIYYCRSLAHDVFVVAEGLAVCQNVVRCSFKREIETVLEHLCDHGGNSSRCGPEREEKLYIEAIYTHAAMGSITVLRQWLNSTAFPPTYFFQPCTFSSLQHVIPPPARQRSRLPSLRCFVDSSSAGTEPEAACCCSAQREIRQPKCWELWFGRTLEPCGCYSVSHILTFWLYPPRT